MKNRLLRALLTAVLIISASPLVFRAIAADPPLRGEIWETTSQPSMEGMPMQMPATKMKLCVAKDQTEPPGASNSQRNCTNANYQKTGDKVTWDVQCTGPAMTGKGEIVYAADRKSYVGAIKFISAQGNMTIKLSGTKLEDCANPQ